MANDDSRVAFSWAGLPQYAARLLGEAIHEIGQPCAVVGSKPDVPIGGMEEALGQSVFWVDVACATSWAELGVPVPGLFFQSGWSSPAFNSLGDEVRQRGGKVCLLLDNRWRGDARQLAGGPWFRLRMRHNFIAAFVPGKSGRQLARWFGLPDSTIFEGLYGADPALFFNGAPLAQRAKRILFVGQYIERKGCLPLARSFCELAEALPGWELHMYGSGPLQASMPDHDRVHVNGFVQPERLGALYRDCRVFALPSMEEHWGLVVHEAALSGCQLLLSDAVGSATDLARRENSAVFRAGDVNAMKGALRSLSLLDGQALHRAQTASLEQSAAFGPSVFASQVATIVSLAARM